MSDIEDLVEKPTKKSEELEKKPKKKRKEEAEVGSGDEDASQQKNEKKRKREEVILTEEDIAAQKAEKSRKKWKKRDAKVHLPAKRCLPFSSHVRCLFASLMLDFVSLMCVSCRKRRNWKRGEWTEPRIRCNFEARCLSANCSWKPLDRFRVSRR